MTMESLQLRRVSSIIFLQFCFGILAQDFFEVPLIGDPQVATTAIPEVSAT